MTNELIFSIIIPFIGTVLGSACVFLVKNKLSDSVQKAFSGFAAGVMIAASIWSLILPSFEASKSKEFALVPVLIGLWLGFIFLMLLDKIIPHMHIDRDEVEGPKASLKKSTMTALAVALHNLPEGIAVGVVLASAIATKNTEVVNYAVAIPLAVGIAVQNFPEGAIISLPLHDSGVKKSKTFLLGVLSGVVEPLGAILTLLLANFITPALPYLLSFAAGAMIYVVIEELIPEMSKGKHSHIGVLCFIIGFSLMMVLDYILG